MAYILDSEIVEIIVQQGTTFNISFRAFVLIIHRLFTIMVYSLFFTKQANIFIKITVHILNKAFVFQFLCGPSDRAERI